MDFIIVSNCRNETHYIYKVKETAERVGHVTDALTIICRKASKQKIVTTTVSSYKAINVGKGNTVHYPHLKK